MQEKIYRMVGIDTAMELLRPGAKWEISNTMFTRWEDPRPCPTIEEVFATIDKIREFEDSIQTVWLPEQYAAIKGQNDMIQKAING
ncbi:MAG: hypothetical protein EB003_12335 [Flavobacteriia bacterium]|jgi:hypothetical protein|nr:hypothetical protein [Flavobacteriia bacterium]